MTNHVTGTGTPCNVPSFSLGELRQYVLPPLLSNPLFTKAEQLRANHFVHECEDSARLTRWGANVLAEIAHRQATAARQRRYSAMDATLGQLRPTNFRGHHSRLRRPTSNWLPGVFFPDHADRWAGTFDRLAATRFQPAGSLTLADLLSRQSR